MLSSFLCLRPMYIDSTNDAVPGGDTTVAKLLRDHVEPLLKVSMNLGEYVVLYACIVLTAGPGYHKYTDPYGQLPTIIMHTRMAT